jgi:ABC-type sugar transport system ATPase subunit
LGERAAAAAASYGFDRRRLGAPAGALSGGNQQKLLLARWRHRRPRILLADEPTRGIDIGAKKEIMHRMRQLADDGLAILFVSSDLDEVVALSDRTLVLAAGRLAGEMPPGCSVADILRAAFSLQLAHA